MANEPVDILPGSLHPDDRIGFTSEAPRSHLSSAEIEQPYRDMAQALEKWSGATNAVAVPLAERQAYADLANQKITRDPSGKIQVLNPANSVMFGEAGQRYNEIVRKGTALQAGQMLDLGMVEDASRNMLNPAGFNAASDARIDKFQEEFGHTPWGAQAVMHGRERQIEHLEGITNRAALNDVQNNKINLEAQIKSLKQDLLGLAATPGSENSPQFKQLHDSLYSYLDSLPANPLYHTPKNLVELEKKQFETEMAGERVASSVPKLIDEQGLPAARKSVDDFLARGDLDPAIRRQVGASMRAQLAEATPKWREADQGYSISVERAERAMGAHTIDTPGNPTSDDVRNLIAAGSQRGYSATPRLIADADAHGVFKAMGRLTPAQRAEAAGLPEPAAGNLFFGDSIAEGYRTAAGAQGDTKVGRPPKEVLQSILGWSGPLKGQSVDLSTGLSNSHSEADFATVEKQIEALRARGVEPASIQVRGVGDRPDLAGVNDRLAKIAKDNGATFLGPLQNLSPDRVHPASYSGSAHPASAFANPGPAPSSGVIGGPGYAEYKARTAQIESGGREGAVSSAGATGKYQFMPATLAKYGGGEEGMDRLTNDNWKTLRNGLGRNPTWAELYLAHQQGAQGALHLMAEPNRPAAEIVGVKAITGNGGTAGMTAGQFVRMWETTYNGGHYRPGAGTATAAAGAPHYSASEIAANPWLGAAIFQGESDPESKLSYFNAHLSVADRSMKLGDLPDRQQWADIETLHAAHAGDPRWEEKYSEVKGRLDATLAERLPPAEQAAWKSNVAAAAGGQGDPYIKAQATSALEHFTQLDKNWQEKPLAMAQSTGLVPQFPPLAQPDAGDAVKAMDARGQAAAVVSARRGEPVSALEGEDLNFARQLLNSGTIQQKLTLLEGMRNFTPPILNATLAKLGKMEGQGGYAIAGGLMAANRPEVAQAILQGKELLAKDPKLAPSGADMDRLMDQTLPAKDFTAGDARVAIADAARAVYAASSAAGQGRTGDKDADRWKQAVDRVTGGVFDFHSSKVIAPWYGATADDLDRALRSLDDTDLANAQAADGSKLTAKQLQNPNSIGSREGWNPFTTTLTLESVGANGGGYMIRAGQTYLRDARTGAPFVLDLTGKQWTNANVQWIPPMGR